MGNQAHDERGRFASGDGSGGKVTDTVRERQAMRAMVDARKFAATRTSNRNIKPAALYPSTNPNARLERTDMPHMRGVDAATLGKTLAQVSAMGATTATIKSGS